MTTKSVTIRCASVPQRGDVPAVVEFSAMRPSGVETIGARTLGTLLECAGIPSWEASGRTFKITIEEIEPCPICDGSCEYVAIGTRAPRDNHELSIILAHTARGDHRAEASS